MLRTSAVLAALMASAAASAAPRVVVPEALQRSAVLCLGEALRLCPRALSSNDYGLSCIVGQRRRLSPPCRGVYDQGMSFLKGGDVHLTLRQPKVK